MEPNKNADLEEALEAIRFTQEYAQLPCVDGWSWWDFYRKHRPEDAERLKREWERWNDVLMNRSKRVKGV